MSAISKKLWPPSLLFSAIVFAEVPPKDHTKQQVISAPAENQSENLRPDMQTARNMAEQLLSVINSDNRNAAANVFFPEAPFLVLKDIPEAAKYYQQLLKEFHDHIHSHHTKLDSTSDLKLTDFKPGFCKWKDIGSEYNKIPYWSCYRSEITATSDKNIKIKIPIKVMINWGPNWYVTHLGKSTGTSIKISPKKTSD